MSSLDSFDWSEFFNAGFIRVTNLSRNDGGIVSAHPKNTGYFALEGCAGKETLAIIVTEEGEVFARNYWPNDEGIDFTLLHKFAFKGEFPETQLLSFTIGLPYGLASIVPSDLRERKKDPNWEME